MPARLSCLSSSLNPNGSIKWRRVLVAAQRRATFPVLGGISGSTRTMCIIKKSKELAPEFKTKTSCLSGHRIYILDTKLDGDGRSKRPVHALNQGARRTR